MRMILQGHDRRKSYTRQRSEPKETYYYITGQRINKRQWNDLVKRYGLAGDNVMEGRTTIAYRRVRVNTEAENVVLNGNY